MASKINGQARSTRSAKRLRDLSSETPIEQEIKSPRLSSGDKSFLVALIRESETLMADFIKESIEVSEKKHFEYIKELISESENRIRCFVETEFSNFKSTLCDITERVSSLENKCLQIECLQNDINDLKKKLLVHENSAVANSIRISGVPSREDENLQSIFNNICLSLNIRAPNIENIYRLTKIYKNNRPYTPNDEVIVVKLQSPYEKNFVLKSIAKYRRFQKTTLTLRQAGIESDQPIYVNENLTPHNHKIFTAALRMKKEKQIYSAYTLRGLVYIKKRNTDDPVLVEFLEDLDRLFR